MLATQLLRQQHAARALLFGRTNCSLCEVAKAQVEAVARRRSFHYDYIDVMQKGHEKWKEQYEFDTPVVRSMHIYFSLYSPDTRYTLTLLSTRMRSPIFTRKLAS